MKDISISDNERKILEYISKNQTPTAEDILEDVFGGEAKKKDSVYYYLRCLKKKKLIQSKALFPQWGASSSQYFYLLTNGSRILNIKHVPTTFRTFTSDTYVRRQIALEVKDVCKDHDWLIYEKNEECRFALLSYLKMQPVSNLNGSIYEDIIPQRIAPDLVIYIDQRTACIVSIAHVASDRDAFRRKLERYEGILNYVKFVGIGLNEYHKEEWDSILKTHQPSHKLREVIESARGILTISPTEVHKVEKFLVGNR